MHTRPTFTLLLALSPLGLCACGAGGVFEGNPFATSNEELRRTALARLKAVQPLPDALAARTDARASLEAGPGAEAALTQSIVAQKDAFDAREPVPLTLIDLREATLRNNLDLAVARMDPAIARERVNEEAARFAAVLDVTARYSDARQATGSRVSTQESRDLSIDPRLRVPLRTGGEITLSPTLSRVEQDNEFAQIPEFYEAGATVSISQPLLRGAGRQVTLAPLRIAINDEQASMARTRLEATAQLAEAERAYWRLYASRAALGVRAEQLAIADRQLAQSRRRVDEGASATVEVDRARAGLASRVEALILAQNDSLERQRRLRALSAPQGESLDIAGALTPSNLPAPAPITLDRPALLALAEANRMELLELELALASDAARVLIERNATLPDLRFLASYALSGLDEELANAVDNAADRQSRSWSVGASLSMPLDNSAARSRLQAALLTHMQRGITRQARTRTIREQTLRACDALETAWQRILASRLAALAAGTALASEQRQFDAGRATSTQVLDAASRLADAQLAEIQALADYELAFVDLGVATGTLLGASGVEASLTTAP